MAAGTNFTAAGIGDGVLEIIDFRANQNKDEASVNSIKVSPLSASWAKTKADRRDQQVLALLLVSAAVSGITVKSGEQKVALLSIAQISTTQPVKVDLAGGRRVDVAQITVAGLQAALERTRNGALVLPFLSVPKVPSVPSVPVVASSATTNARQIDLVEICKDKALFALRDQSFSAAQSCQQN